MSTDREREALARLIDSDDRWMELYLAVFSGLSGPGDTIRATRDKTLDILAGWMPRPEPGTEAWKAMVERGARAIWEQPGSGCSWDRLAQHVRGQCINDATACLRAALAAPDTGGADGE